MNIFDEYENGNILTQIIENKGMYKIIIITYVYTYKSQSTKVKRSRYFEVKKEKSKLRRINLL